MSEASTASPGGAVTPEEQFHTGASIKVATVAALGGFLFGYDSAVINGAVSAIGQVFDVESTTLGFAVASALLGAAAGAMSAGRIADRFGRLRVMQIAAVLFLVSALGAGFATNIGMLIAFRIIGGLGVGIASVIAPAYIAEIAPASLRDVSVRCSSWPSSPASSSRCSSTTSSPPLPAGRPSPSGACPRGAGCSSR